MKGIAFVLIGLCTVSVLSAGCGAALSDAFVSPTAKVELARRHYRVVKHGLEARACAVRVLGIGVGDLSYARAAAALNEKAIASGMTGEYTFVNVVASRNVEFYLLGWRTCTVVEADIAVLLEPVYEIGLVADSREEPIIEPARIPQAPATQAPVPAFSPKVAQDDCQAGKADSCLELAKAHETGAGMIQNPSLARERYLDACDKGSADGCFEAGQLWATGQGAPADSSLARQMFDKACELRHGQACAELSIMVREGRGGAADEQKAQRLARKACRLGSLESCPTR